MKSKTVFVLCLLLIVSKASEGRQTQQSKQKTEIINEHDQKAQQIQKDHDFQLRNQTLMSKINDFFGSCQIQLGQWLSLPRNKSLDQAIYECYVSQNATQLLSFYDQLSQIGQNFTRLHIDAIPKLFRKYKYVSGVLFCLSMLRQFQNKFFKEKKKLKYALQFIKAHPEHTQSVFPQHQNYTLKGQKTCYFLKVLFQYYYVQVVSSMQSLSTSFLRALTLRSDVFQHYDISYCVSLQTSGKLSQALEDMDINNIFLKVPDIFHELKYLKLKQKCKDAQNTRLLKNLQNALQGLDMFTIMYHDHQPYVTMATQKFGNTQIRLMARQFAIILNDREYYRQLSKTKIDREKPKEVEL